MSLTQLSTESRNQRIRKIIKTGLILLALALFVTAAVLFSAAMGDLLKSIFFAVIIAYLLMPVERMLEKHFPSGISALISVFLLFGGLITVIILIVPVFARELSSLSSGLNSAMNYISEKFSSINDIADKIGIRLEPGRILSDFLLNAEKEGNNLSEGLHRITEKLPSVVLLPILTFYFLKDRELLGRSAAFLIPVKLRKTVSGALTGADKIIKHYVRTQLVVAVIVGAATTVGYIFIGVPYAFILGLFMGFCEMIPYFGPWIGAVPAALVVAAWSPEKLLFTLLVVLAVQQLEGNFLSPYLMGIHFDIHPVTVLTVLWVSGRILGFTGFIFGIPIFVILRDLSVSAFNKIVKAG